ncbi:MAG: hydrolase [Candidatus Omnitrophica bacterium]|nr:hydrolase [Candidatus Omnitrophota bacterium]
MLYTLEQSVLVVVDIQGNLAAAMQDREALFANVIRLIKAAGRLRVPVIVTEQVPEKIGSTVPEIASVFPPDASRIPKESFSCWGCPDFRERLKASLRREVILCGIEAHVCISQTALDLLQADFRVGCVADAISARTADNKRLGLSRIENAGAELLSTEMIITELLRTSAHPEFKSILQLIK